MCFWTSCLKTWILIEVRTDQSTKFYESFKHCVRFKNYVEKTFNCTISQNHFEINMLIEHMV
jgi:hypothetical protein